MSNGNQYNRGGLTALSDRIDDRLVDLYRQAASEYRNVWEMEGYKELNDLRQLAGALRHGTLDGSRFDAREVEMQIRRALNGG